MTDPERPGRDAEAPAPAIRVERRDRVAILTLDRPPLNVLDLAALAQLGAELTVLAADPGLQVLVVRGAGQRAFSAGVAVEDHTPGKVPEMLALFHGALEVLRTLPAATLAVVQGHCLGGGMEVVAACDLVLAERGARFGQPEIELGCFPPYAAALLPRRLGHGRALELLVTGRRLDAAEAEQLGLVTWVTDGERLDEELERRLGELSAHSAAVTRLTKRALTAAGALPFDRALAESERLYQQELLATADAEEGVAAFLARRPPRWRHR